MSVTTTANPITYNTLSVLADYELHHSESQQDSTLNPHPAPAEGQEQQSPDDWPADYRRVPAYRPINTELDQSQRRVYLSNVERGFITMMFLGVRTNAMVSRIWHATGGRINNDIFRYKIGGEW